MMKSQTSARLRDLLSKAALLADTLRSLARTDGDARRRLELLECDIARLSAALESDNRQTVLLALAFPSLDGRAADALGELDLEDNPATALQYHVLNQSLVAAIAALNAI
ncbi:MAG: hypothetical protein J0I52_02375 [Bordetella sp.]|nr:hypothetical protein [Bordetella sp.]